MNTILTGDDASARKQRAALWSLVASAGLTVAKLVAGLLSGSLALLSEAAHGLIDVVATTITYFAVREADKPADAEHHYGHGKIEAVAALVETALLVALALWVVWAAADRLLGTPPLVEATPLAFAVLIVAIVVDAWRWRALDTVARETRSEALAADALHFASDLVSSALALVGLALVAAGYAEADALAAIGVALFIGVAAWRLGGRTLNTLLDTAPKGLAERMGALAGDVPGVVAVTSVRLRPVGGRVMGDVAVDVARTLPFDRVAAIKDRIAAAINSEIPEAEVMVHTRPRALDDETVLDRVMLIAARRRIPAHHVIVQRVDGRLAVGLDLEVDGRMSLAAAHTLATRFEAAIREELGPDVEVDTHIEPLRVSQLEGRDEAGPLVERIDATLRETAARIGQIGNVHSVRVRRTEDGLVVNYHCCFDDGLTVASVHAHVDELERRLRAAHPEILRAVGHAEPADHD